MSQVSAESVRNKHTEAADAVTCGPACACAPAGPMTSVPLTSLRRGQAATICSKDLGREDSAVLRAMGLRPAARIRMCRVGEPCIVVMQCRCGDACRIGLALSLARKVNVLPS